MALQGAESTLTHQNTLVICEGITAMTRPPALPSYFIEKAGLSIYPVHPKTLRTTVIRSVGDRHANKAQFPGRL